MVAGCGSSSSSTSSDSSSSSSSSSSGKITLCIAQRDEFLSTLEEGVKNNCPTGYTVDTQDAQGDAAKQLQQVETAKNGGAKAIIVNICDVETAAQIKEAAGTTPLVFVNRLPSDSSVFDATWKCSVRAASDTVLRSRMYFSISFSRSSRIKSPHVLPYYNSYYRKVAIEIGNFLIKCRNYN